MAAKFIWKRDPLRLIGHLENVAKSRTLQLAKQIYTGVVMRTPVRTGSLRASWRAAVGQPDMSKVTHDNPNSPLAPPSFPLTSIPPYSKVYISNSHKYVLPIEYGWSGQAPQGMVRVTLASLGIGMNVS